MEETNAKVVILWEGKYYQADTWDDVYSLIAKDPWFGNMRALKDRVKACYGYSLGRTRTKKQLFQKLSAMGELSIIKAEV